MSLWSRIANVVRGNRLSREIDEEFESHIAGAIEQGRDPAEARRAFGSPLRYREESRDVRLIAWIESLRADAVFGWRQLSKNSVTSAAAILSLALAIGACTSAFRLIDALLLRPLPVTDPERLYVLAVEKLNAEGKPITGYSFSYPFFREMRAAVKEQAELLAVSYAQRTDVTYQSDQEMEKAHVQYVSGWIFGSLGVRPALGRVLTENDDLTPGAHPYAVLSHDYWTQRFGQDPQVIGRTFRLGNDLCEIVGVAEEGFTGTEPGIVISIFIPTMMKPERTIASASAFWFRTLLRPKPDAAVESIAERLQITFRTLEEERLKGFRDIPEQRRAQLSHFKLSAEPAASGVSTMQEDYQLPLTVLGALVLLVLLIACVNVANLMSAQAAARSRDVALRVSIGAGRARLVQLVLAESALLAFAAAAIGWLFAWWSAPFVVSMLNPPDNPARLILPADWRVFGFGLALALCVTILFGLAPALGASAVRPVSVLKGGEDPHSRRRLMHALVAVQAAFCFLVLFLAGLFVTTFDRLSNVRMGFSAQGLLTLDTVAQPSQLPAFWDQMREHLRSTPGVEAVALAEWPLLSGMLSNSYIWINGAPADEELTYFVPVSPGWMDTMKIPVRAGADFRAGDTHPGVAIVNDAFAKQFLNRENPVGRSFERTGPGGQRIPFKIVGLVGDVRDRDLRNPVPPTVYVPLNSLDGEGALPPRRRATFVVRTSGDDPLTLAPVLRQAVSQARAQFRVSNIRTQEEIIDLHTLRERLLAMLALFFAAVALLLAAVGLYGVLHYSVVQRRREIGIRMALGAQAFDVARQVTSGVLAMVFAGALAGLALGMGAVRYIEALFYEVKATDLPMLALPSLAILAATVLAALPAVIRAVRTDPAATLRAE